MLGAYYAEQGREDQLDDLLTEIRAAEAEARREGQDMRAGNLSLAAEAGEAYGWAKNGDSAEREEAIQRLRALQGTGMPGDVWIRWWLGELYLEDDRPREASVYLEAMRSSGVPHVANFLLGRAYTELGEQVKARAAYVRFLQAWEEADPDLPQVDEARAALEELLAG
jgi:predicted Zn-dependent protease